MYSRKEIEDKWIEKSVANLGGYPLCFTLDGYFKLKYIFLEDVFIGDFVRDHAPIMNEAFMYEGYHDYTSEELYLLRALTLNMLLDDNLELLED